MAPSIKQKIDTHLKLIRDIYEILPVKKIVVEVAAFDIQKIKHPDVQGKGYQEGEQLGFWNTREYVLFRDGHKCQHCKGKSGDKILNVHHIESRKTGGDAPNNLVTLCETCHGKYHAGEIQVKIKRGQAFRDTAFMGIMRWAFFNRLKELYINVNLTFGYLTKHTRINAGLEKSHAVDARCISENVLAKPSENRYDQKAVRTRNRQIHKATIDKGGTRKLNKQERYVKGFQLFDAVKWNDREGFVFGRRATGSFDIRKLDGKKLSAGVNCKYLRQIGYPRSVLTERREAHSSNA